MDRFGEDIQTEIADNKIFRAFVKVVPSSTFLSWIFQFLGGMKMTEVAEKTKYCVRQIQRRKRFGLLQVAEILRRQRPMCGYVSPLP